MAESTADMKWLWKANDEVKFYQMANDHGTRIGIALVTLNSVRPLDYDQVMQAFEIVQSKCFNLRIALKNRGDDLWFCELPNAKVDFEVLEENADFYEALDNACKENFNISDKPHWRVRLIPRSLDTPCELSEVKSKFPYQYDYFIQPNHILMDGMNIALIINMSHKVLDDLIDGKPIDSKPYGTFSEASGLEELEDKITQMFAEDPDALEAVRSSLPPAGKSLWLNKTHPRPTVITPTTKHITRTIDSNTLKLLKEKSKAAGVTLNSSLVALIHVAFLDLLQEGDVIEDSYKFHVYHLVNLRRYLPMKEDVALGPYQFAMSHTWNMERTIRDSFWQDIKKYNDDLQGNLKEGAPMKQKVLNKRLRSSSPVSSNYFQKPPPVLHDFSVTNVGDLTPVVPGVGKHVQVTDMCPFNIIHDNVHMNLHQIVTYRGYSRYTLSYDTSYMTNETAQTIIDRVFALLSEFSTW